MNLNPTSILASIVGSCIGYVYFSYGRSQSDWPMVASGIGLMTYSYFVTSVDGLVVVGAAIAAIPFAVRRFRQENS